MKCQLLERPPATISASALTKGFKQGEENATIGPGWFGHPLAFKPPSDTCYSRHLFMRQITVPAPH